jgi:hypothetical protein
VIYVGFHHFLVVWSLLEGYWDARAVWRCFRCLFGLFGDVLDGLCGFSSFFGCLGAKGGLLGCY